MAGTTRIFGARESIATNYELATASRALGDTWHKTQWRRLNAPYRPLYRAARIVANTRQSSGVGRVAKIVLLQQPEHGAWRLRGPQRGRNYKTTAPLRRKSGATSSKAHGALNQHCNGSGERARLTVFCRRSRISLFIVRLATFRFGARCGSHPTTATYATQCAHSLFYRENTTPQRPGSAYLAVVRAAGRIGAARLVYLACGRRGHTRTLAVGHR